MRTLAWVMAAALAACSPSAAAPTSEPDASSADAAADAEASAADAGESPPEEKTTALEVEIDGVVRTLTRAQFGTDDGEAALALHVEAHEGGDPACPTQASPTPKRTVIVAGVPATSPPGASFTKADGIIVSLVDFTGDQLPDKPVASATAATVTVVGIDAKSSAELDVDATLEGGGTVKGRLYATYCESLSN